MRTFYSIGEEKRYKLLRAMNEIVNQLDDETYLVNIWWVYIPEGFTDGDFWLAAKNDNIFNDCVRAFKRIMLHAIK